jgi:type IV pilus assembly protein PilY1
VDACIEAALQDYCGMIEIPEVIDPSDQASETGEFWNIPAVLIDSGKDRVQ